MPHSQVEEAPFSDALGANEAVRKSAWVVMKFGGTSVSTADNWRTIAALVRNRLAQDFRVLIVHSALRGISNELAAALDAAVSGGPEANVDAIREQHYRLADDLGLDRHALLDPVLQELGQLLAGVRLIQEVSPRVRVRVMAMGELMSTALGAAWLNRCGIDCEWRDARKMLASEDHVGRSE